MKNVIIDLDGVVFAMQEELCLYIKEKYPHSNFTLDKIKTYNFNKALPTAKPPEYGLGINRSLLIDALSVPEIYRNAKPYENIISSVNTLTKNFNTIFHSLAFTEQVKLAKEESIDEHFANIPIQTNIIIGNDKPAYFETDYIIEDSIENLIRYSENSVKLLVDKPYNQKQYYPNIDFTKIIRCESAVDAINNYILR